MTSTYRMITVIKRFIDDLQRAVEIITIEDSSTKAEKLLTEIVKCRFVLDEVIEGCIGGKH